MHIGLVAAAAAGCSNIASAHIDRLTLCQCFCAIIKTRRNQGQLLRANAQ